MSKVSDRQVNLFIEAVNKFFSDVESWIATVPIKCRREEIQIAEEAAGSYKVNKLILEDVNGKKIADLTPVATYVIGASGRIDMNGRNDKAILGYLEKGGPSITITEEIGGQVLDTSSKPIYKGIEVAGWYWTERVRARRGKTAHCIDKDQFFELLGEVSDYELD